MGAARCVAADARPVEPLPASGRFELSSAASSQRAVSSRAAVNGGSKSTFDTPLALLQTRAQKPLGQSVLLKAKMRKRAASRERSFDGCPGVSKGVYTAGMCFFVAVGFLYCVHCVCLLFLCYFVLVVGGM